MIKHAKPKTFYDTFERKGAGEKTTHYCPGCGHGTMHKLIAEAIDDMGIGDRVIMHSPVGCSVFAYYYFDTGNIQCSHGRAPAVATGVGRVHKDAVIITYQGDGDLAGIGTSEIIHAANRNENMTVFFVNNAIYGMTGGQMAPTTLEGQKTLTTPYGRDTSSEGDPIGMAELINAIPAPVYIERGTLSSAKGVMKARKAVRKGIQNQIDKKGFSFVEILSPCPINWKMDPVTSRKWIAEELEPVFPVGCFRDTSQDQPKKRVHTPFMSNEDLLKLLNGEVPVPSLDTVELQEDQRVKIAGFGGQGVLSGGIFLAKCGIAENLQASWLPSYGPEMRGGKAYASIILSNEEIGSPVVDDPNVLIALNGPSLDAFEDEVTPGGLILVNSSIGNKMVIRKDITALYIPASEIARKGGLTAAANVVLLAIYIHHSGIMPIDRLKKLIPSIIKRSEFVEANLRMIDKAIDYYNTTYGA